jgi:hypothetical protein
MVRLTKARMILDRTRFETFWSLFVEDSVNVDVEASDPMVISNGVSPELSRALLSSSAGSAPLADCFNEDWI